MTRKFWRCLLPFGLLTVACTNHSEISSEVAYAVDKHSFSRPAQARTTHLKLDLDVDFETKVISGYARHTIENNGGTDFIVDIKGLNILKVTLDYTDEDVNYRKTESDPFLGRALVIPVNAGTQLVTIHYFTDPEAEALGWLEPEQTAGGTQPFLYTQGQAILTRSWLPIQDSPGIRFTYEADIQVPPGLMAVMSATNPTEESEDGQYHFEMEQPIPAYLMALAVGDITYSPLGGRTGVYAEPATLEAASYEFAETEQMLEIAEDLYGPYLWGKYDLLVLPPAFPFGGMENPKLTFVTPTVIAGDRSLVSLIAHELAHSWSGNLVTNGTWDDFWLNEGFTVYFERRIMEALYGDEYTRMLTSLGYQSLESTVERLGSASPDTRLHLDLEGRNPDDGMTDIAYEKGAHFLMRLEELVGRKRFDDFLEEYFNKYQFGTMSTTQFEQYLRAHLLNPAGVTMDLDEWLYQPGLPDDIPMITSDRFRQVDKKIAAFDPMSDGRDGSFDDWTTHEWLHFIANLPDTYDAETYRSIDRIFDFSNSGNAEIAALWYEKSLRHGYGQEILPQISEFLERVGRRKFLMPIYRAMKEEGMLTQARDIYARSNASYHAVSRNSLTELLEL